MSTFLVLQTPVTSAPYDLAICTANVPTPPRRAVNQDLLSRSNLPFVAKTLQPGECRHRYRSCLRERHAMWLDNQCRLVATHILRKGPAAGTEHVIAWFELRYVPADRFDLTGNIDAKSFVLWFAQPCQYAKAVRPTLQHAPVKRIDGRCANFYQYFIVFSNWLLEVDGLDDVRRSVSEMDGGSHVCTRTALCHVGRLTAVNSTAPDTSPIAPAMKCMGSNVMPIASHQEFGRL